MFRCSVVVFIAFIAPLGVLAGTEDLYSQCTLPTKRVELIAFDAGSGRDTISFGHHPSASRGRDSIFCENEVPPMPPSGIFELRFVNPPGYEGQQPPVGMGQGFYHDYRAQYSPTQIDTHKVRFQPGAGGYPVTLSWSIPSLLAMCDSARLVDEFGGVVATARMHQVSSLVVTNPAVTTLLLLKFGAVEVPSPPTLVFPSHGSVNHPAALNLQWGTSSGAITYRLQLANDSTFLTPILDQSGLAIVTFPVSGLLASTTYFWRVAATNGAGTGGWSAASRFSTQGLPGLPVLASPPDGSTNQPSSLDLTWGPAPDASSYHLQVSTDVGFSSLVLDDSSEGGISRSLTLSPGQQYFWRVRGQNAMGSGNWSSPWSFTTESFVTNAYGFVSGWNLVSLPLAVVDPRRVVLFPTATSGAFSFTAQGYQVRDSLLNGTGYWIKMDSTRTVSMTGLPVQRDTVDVRAGWNIIGSIFSPVDVSAIIQIPAGIIQSSFFGYTNGYATTDTLHPARGYWVKLSTNGKLVLSQ